MDKRIALTQEIRKNFIYFIVGSFFVFSLIFTFSGHFQEQQFSYLASSFLHGKLYFEEQPQTMGDIVFWGGYYYWPLGPFPGILLMPFVFIGKYLGFFFYQAYLSFFLILGTFVLAYKMAMFYKFAKEDSILLAFAFCFGSPYQIITVMPWSWYFAHAIAVFFIFLAFYEFFKGKRRFLVIGTLFALAYITRVPTVVGVLFFILWIFLDKKLEWGEKSKQLIFLFAPIFIATGILFAYNFARFGNIFEEGIRYANNTFPEEDRYEVMHFGLFQLRNIPTNFYYYFIKTPDPVLMPISDFTSKDLYILEWPYLKLSFPGVSFFWVAPLFLYILRTNFGKKVVKLAFVPVILILFIYLMYYWTGWRQIGPRYFLDFLPFLYIILLHSFRNNKLPLFAQVLIIVSAIFNLHLFGTMFNQ